MSTINGPTSARRTARRRAGLALVAVGAAALAGCGDASDAGLSATNAAVSSEIAATTASSSAAPPATDVVDAPVTTVPLTNEQMLAERCRMLGRTFLSHPWPSSLAAVPAYIEGLRTFVARAPRPDTPHEASGEVGDLGATMQAAQDEWDHVEEAAGRNDEDETFLALERADDLLTQTIGMTALSGVECLGADPATNAIANVPLLGAWQIENAFGSIWVSRQFMDEVVRIDPSSGEVTARIAVDSQPVKLQGAGGRVWVRTADSLQAIDPVTNTVTATLRKADVGPEANRSWAVDGALWICDGTMLHRYDPTTLELVTSIDVGIHCGQVHATDEVVTAWTLEEGGSVDAQATFVDPTTNTVIRTVDLPNDVGVPIVLDDRVILFGYHAPTAAVVDRDTWDLVDTVDLGVRTGGSQPAYDGSLAYVTSDDKLKVFAVDPESLAVVDEIVPFEANSLVAADDGGFWTASNTMSYVQHFARPEVGAG